MKKALNLKSIYTVVMICMMLSLTTVGFSQDPGGGPDGPPPAVPFDDYLLPIILVLGSIVSFFVFRKLKTSTTTH